MVHTLPSPGRGSGKIGVVGLMVIPIKNTQIGIGLVGADHLTAEKVNLGYWQYHVPRNTIASAFGQKHRTFLESSFEHQFAVTLGQSIDGDIESDLTACPIARSNMRCTNVPATITTVPRIRNGIVLANPSTAMTAAVKRRIRCKQQRAESALQQKVKPVSQSRQKIGLAHICG